jgi:hypothetical protein
MLYTPGEIWRGRAEIELEGGEVTFRDWDAPRTPEWMIDLAQAFLRAEWRARGGDAAKPWPVRISRWRAERLA